MLSKFSKKMISIFSIVMVGLISFTAVGTLAAFSAHERHTEDITIDLGYGKYFANGSGKVNPNTNQREYFIETPDHLRNLSYLVGLGAFNEQDKFILNKTISWDTKGPLIPIGSDHAPFKSQFEGKLADPNSPFNVPFINNMEVTGTNLSDVGMFGFVASSASLNNFGLGSPVIKSVGENSFDYSTIDKNPLRKVFTKDLVRTVSFTPTYADANVGEASGATSITFNITGLPADYKIMNGSTQLTIPYEYEFVLSNSNVGTFNGSNNTLAISGTYQPANVDIKKNPGEYFTLSIFVKGLVDNSTNGAGDFRYSTFMVENFKFYYDYATHTVIIDKKNSKAPAKMINPGPTTIEFNKTEGIYRHIDKSHGLYVGIIAGHLDGNANNIAVYNPSIRIERPFISNSLLFGKKIDDDDISTLSKEQVCFGAVNGSENPIDLSWKYISPNLVNYNETNSDVGLGNRLVNGLYGADFKLSASAENTLRFYGTNNMTNDDRNKVNIGGGFKDKYQRTVKDGASLDKTHEVYTDGNGKYITDDKFKIENINSYTPVDFKGITYSDEIAAGFGKVYDKLLVRRFDNLRVSNAIQMWISAADNKGGIEKFWNSGIDFYLNFEFDYLFFDDDYPNLVPSKYDANQDGSQTKTVSDKRLQVLGARKSIKAEEFGLFFKEYAHYDDLGSGASNTHEVFPSHYPLDIVKSKNGNDGTFRYADVLDPKNKIDDRQADNSDILKFHNDKNTGNSNAKIRSEIAGPIPAANDDKTYVVQTKKIRIHPNLEGFKPSIGNKNKYPIFFVGLNDTTPAQTPDLPPDDPGYIGPNSNYELFILGFRMLISDLQGNFNQTIGTVDFTDNATSMPNKNSKFNSSNVRVTIKTLANDYTNSNTANEELHVAYEAVGNGGSDLVTAYDISVKRSQDTVTVTYKITGGNSANFNYIYPHNTDGFKPAVFSPAVPQK